MLNLILFFITVITTLLSGSYLAGFDPILNPIYIIKGAPFSFTLLFILLSHELAHYFYARKWGVNASLPYFIPGLVLPPPYLSVGTFGAFITIRGKIKNKNALFDIGASGPLASLFTSLLAFIIGLSLSKVLPFAEDGNGIFFGESILCKSLSYIIFGVSTDKVTILLHPIALAAWFGFFVTMLNLIPIGQLDGGHIIYSVFGKQHKLISRCFVVVLFIIGYFFWSGWVFWGFLLLVMGTNHPRLDDEIIYLSRTRKLLAWLILLILILIFMESPFIINF